MLPCSGWGLTKSGGSSSDVTRFVDINIIPRLQYYNSCSYPKDDKNLREGFNVLISLINKCILGVNVSVSMDRMLLLKG